MEQNENVISHLRQAISHLDAALSLTIDSLKENPSSKKSIGKIWEEFLGTFFNKVRSKGKENNVNLLSLISFPKLKKF
ncbi:hypothetical protein J5Y03_08980 [Bacillus sp. RG28]|uniref:Uncharacterized protein n=1 Tax=Gottfriedia endophytica TaxID=2820819 RepID=A0A940NUW8_9BACI|nr:hypothetical protein [Gottfriedia endophytica]MBP0725323.1 hypothetical protein [Gottfriedia endophytica]